MLRDKLAIFGALAAAGLIVLNACGNNKGPAASGGDGGAGSEDAGAGGGGGGVVADVCAKASAYDQQCGGNACMAAELADCAQIFGVFSSGYLSAIDACVSPPHQCTDGGMSSTDNLCMQSKLATLAPTLAQSKVKTDFCALCPDGQSARNPHACSSFFAVTDGGSSIGTAILELNDSVAEEVDQGCASGSHDSGIADCDVSFEICAATILEHTIVLPAACMTDAG